MRFIVCMLCVGCDRSLIDLSSDPKTRNSSLSDVELHYELEMIKIHSLRGQNGGAERKMRKKIIWDHAYEIKKGGLLGYLISFTLENEIYTILDDSSMVSYGEI